MLADGPNQNLQPNQQHPHPGQGTNSTSQHSNKILGKRRKRNRRRNRGEISTRADCQAGAERCLLNSEEIMKEIVQRLVEEFSVGYRQIIAVGRVERIIITSAGAAVCCDAARDSVRANLAQAEKERRINLQIQQEIWSQQHQQEEVGRNVPAVENGVEMGVYGENFAVQPMQRIRRVIYPPLEDRYISQWVEIQGQRNIFQSNYTVAVFPPLYTGINPKPEIEQWLQYLQSIDFRITQETLRVVIPIKIRNKRGGEMRWTVLSHDMHDHQAYIWDPLKNLCECTGAKDTYGSTMKAIKRCNTMLGAALSEKISYPHKGNYLTRQNHVLDVGVIAICNMQLLLEGSPIPGRRIQLTRDRMNECRAAIISEVENYEYAVQEDMRNATQGTGQIHQHQDIIGQERQGGVIIIDDMEEEQDEAQFQAERRYAREENGIDMETQSREGNIQEDKQPNPASDDSQQRNQDKYEEEKESVDIRTLQDEQMTHPQMESRGYDKCNIIERKEEEAQCEEKYTSQLERNATVGTMKLGLRGAARRKSKALQKRMILTEK